MQLSTATLLQTLAAFLASNAVAQPVNEATITSPTKPAPSATSSDTNEYTVVVTMTRPTATPTTITLPASTVTLNASTVTIPPSTITVGSTLTLIPKPDTTTSTRPSLIPLGANIPVFIYFDEWTHKIDKLVVTRKIGNMGSLANLIPDMDYDGKVSDGDVIKYAKGGYMVACPANGWFYRGIGDWYETYEGGRIRCEYSDLGD